MLLHDLGATSNGNKELPFVFNNVKETHVHSILVVLHFANLTSDELSIVRSKFLVLMKNDG